MLATPYVSPMEEEEENLPSHSGAPAVSNEEEDREIGKGSGMIVVSVVMVLINSSVQNLLAKISLRVENFVLFESAWGVVVGKKRVPLPAPRMKRLRPLVASRKLIPYKWCVTRADSFDRCLRLPALRLLVVLVPPTRMSLYRSKLGVAAPHEDAVGAVVVVGWFGVVPVR